MRNTPQREQEEFKAIVLRNRTRPCKGASIKRRVNHDELIAEHLVRHSNRSMDNGDGDGDDDLKKPSPAAAPTTPSEGLTTISE